MSEGFRIAVLVGGKGRGTNLSALLKASRSGQLNAAIVLVIAPSMDLPAARTALDAGVALEILDPKARSFGPSLVRLIDKFEVDALCLAGFLQLLPAEVLHRLPERVFNIHPSLLPKFGGKGMYGWRVHEAVLNSGECESGCTVHLVSEQYDDGRIVLQLKCPVLKSDTVDSLAARVLELEQVAYPEAIRKVLHGKDST